MDLYRPWGLGIKEKNHEDSEASPYGHVVHHLLALGRRRDPKHLSRFADALTHGDAEVRCMAARALGWLRLPAAAEPLAGAMNDKNADVRRWAASSLALTGKMDHGECLIQAVMTDSAATVRAACTRTLGWLGIESGVSALSHALRADPDGEVRAGALQALARMKRRETAPDWIAALKDPHAGVRCQAIRALGNMSTVDLMDELVRLTKDSDPEVRCVAVRILAKKGSEEPFSSESDAERAAALLACKRALKDRNAGVRATGAVGLNWLGAIDFIPQLQALLDDPHPEVTYQAGRAVHTLESLRASKAHGRRDSVSDPIPPHNPESK